jgi:hypothetical protein
MRFGPGKAVKVFKSRSQEGAALGRLLEGSRFSPCRETWRYLAISRIVTVKRESWRLPRIIQRHV